MNVFGERYGARQLMTQSGHTFRQQLRVSNFAQTPSIGRTKVLPDTSGEWPYTLGIDFQMLDGR
jgi:hypothetical protein